MLISPWLFSIALKNSSASLPAMGLTEVKFRFDFLYSEY